MEEKPFVWNTDLTKKLCQLKFDYDWLFRKRKQPWLEFYKILMENGFPEEMTIDQVRKKWSYTWDTYKVAKKNRKKGWKYYKIFEKHYGKKVTLDKFESWPDKWRLKLITSIAESMEHKLDTPTLWRTVERDMRSQDLPQDCCIQDIKALWHHLKMSFTRKHRVRLRNKTDSTEWVLYDAMLDFYKKYETEDLFSLEAETQQIMIIPMAKGLKSRTKDVDSNNDVKVFNWTKNITESFIQVRLQNDHLFKEKYQAWKEFVIILRNEYGFPTTLSSREACRKWATIISDYQKARATNNKSWVYYNLFELYLGDGKLSLNPIVDWQEEWVFNFISARTDLEHVFEYSNKDRNDGWREVEKRLRCVGIPLDHSLLDLAEIWSYLRRTFRWKRKFKNKGVLTEHWPYFEAMERYTQKPQPKIERTERKQTMEQFNDNNDDFDCEDDIKLFDLKQKLEVKPVEVDKACRACADTEARINIFEHKDDEGTDLAAKLKLVGGIEVEQSDNLPTQICYNCLQELETAYKFRRKCQNADKQLRNPDQKIKVEYQENTQKTNEENMDDDMDRTELDFAPQLDAKSDHKNDRIPKTKSNTVKKVKIIRRKKIRKSRYDYWKICEVCGKNTKNLMSHLDAHNVDKKYSCEVCDKKFKFKSGLIIHKAVHDPTPRKTCEVCGKTFHILAQYRKHFVYHANERKFECETCGKRFNTFDILRVHNMTHTDERPFSCPECGKTFRTAGCVSRHKRIVHRNVKKVQ